ncbi:MAG: heme exporter protein CcmD [Rhizobiaceae bacterium]|nr:heme exporter protein CcmD [Rhizobiaceae bacterium]MBL4695964.1 heme exporter protein CcmD [Rhizobiaceae bacterium]
MFGPHTAFIVPSYLATAAVILILVVWTMIEHKAQRTEIARLEKSGIKRRSDKSDTNRHG